MSDAVKDTEDKATKDTNDAVNDAAKDTEDKAENNAEDQAIFDKVKGIVVEQLGSEEDDVKRTSSFTNDLGADSLDTVELVMALEEEFDIEIPDDAAEGIATVQAAVDYIVGKQG